MDHDEMEYLSEILGNLLTRPELQIGIRAASWEIIPDFVEHHIFDRIVYVQNQFFEPSDIEHFEASLLSIPGRSDVIKEIVLAIPSGYPVPEYDGGSLEDIQSIIAELYLNNPDHQFSNQLTKLVLPWTIREAGHLLAQYPNLRVIGLAHLISTDKTFIPKLKELVLLHSDIRIVVFLAVGTEHIAVSLSEISPNIQIVTPRVTNEPAIYPGNPKRPPVTLSTNQSA